MIGMPYSARFRKRGDGNVIPTIFLHKACIYQMQQIKEKNEIDFTRSLPTLPRLREAPYTVQHQWRVICGCQALWYGVRQCLHFSPNTINLLFRAFAFKPLISHTVKTFDNHSYQPRFHPPTQDHQHLLADSILHHSGIVS